MTWSIVAHDAETGALAVAVTTCNLAVGAAVPHLRAGVGAVATQSFTNRYLGPAILDALERGHTPEDAIESALAGDRGRGIRQVHVVDRHGRTAAHTGANCVAWCGHRTGEHFSVAGNMLAGQAVVAHTYATFHAHKEMPLQERLLTALDAGQAAGGDRRGKQSAAMALITTEDFCDLDLRVDDHAEPLEELRRLLGLWRSMREPGLLRSPHKANPSGETDLDMMEAEWIARGSDLRFTR